MFKFLFMLIAVIVLLFIGPADGTKTRFNGLFRLKVAKYLLILSYVAEIIKDLVVDYITNVKDELIFQIMPRGRNLECWGDLIQVSWRVFCLIISYTFNLIVAAFNLCKWVKLEKRKEIEKFKEDAHAITFWLVPEWMQKEVTNRGKGDNKELEYKILYLPSIDLWPKYFRMLLRSEEQDESNNSARILIWFDGIYAVVEFVLALITILMTVALVSTLLYFTWDPDLWEKLNELWTKAGVSFLQFLGMYYRDYRQSKDKVIETYKRWFGKKKKKC